MRDLLALILLLVVSTAAHAAFVSEPAGSGTCSLNKGSTCYRDFTANGADSVSIAACANARVNFRSNIADAADNDGSATVYVCPAGVTTVTAACGQPVWTALTGASGADNVYGVVGQNLVVSVTTTGQTSRVQVDCR